MIGRVSDVWHTGATHCGLSIPISGNELVTQSRFKLAFPRFQLALTQIAKVP